MGNTSLIIRALEIVGIIVSMAGGFLSNVAPPSDNNIWLNQFALGIGFVIILTSLFIIWSLATYYANKLSIMRWNMAALVSLAIFLSSGIYYFSLLNRYTYLEPQTKTHSITRVHGNELTSLAEVWRQSHPNPTKQEMLYSFGYEHSAIWVEAATRRMEILLLVVYLLVVMSMALAVLSLSEGALQRIGTAKLKPPMGAG